MSSPHPDAGELRLIARQFLFARLLPRLIDRAHYLGFKVTMGEAWRSEAAAKWNASQGKGISNSLHRDRLAVDLNLFDKNGKYLSTTEAHKPLGEWWEQQHELCRWGGRFNDGNHYSITYGGRK